MNSFSTSAPQLHFQDRVAIVTGAGRGIGREYAVMLAERGARVVVNDLGGNMLGEGSDKSPADEVVRIIREKGGTAIANYDTVENGKAIVAQAMETFGRIDILINNAAIIRDGSFLKLSEEDWDKVYRVNLLGSFNMCKAVWPIMRKQRYGRIVNCTSASGLYGNFGQANYAACKMAVIGLSNVLHKEGAKYNVNVNTVSPIAGTRLTETILPEHVAASLKPQYTAPIVLYLCHDSCLETGGIFELGGGWVGKLRFERSQGAVFPLDMKLFTPEQVAAQWDHVVDFGRVCHPSSTQESFDPVMRNVNCPPRTVLEPHSLMKSSAIFERLKIIIEEEGKQLVDKVNGVLQWNIMTKTNAVSVWTVDLTSGGEGCVVKGTLDGKSPDLVLALREDTFLALCEGKYTPEKAILQRRLKLQGNLKLARKVAPLVSLLYSKAKL